MILLSHGLLALQYQNKKHKYPQDVLVVILMGRFVTTWIIYYFAINIKAVLEDDTEVENVKGFLIDDKRVYKTSNNTVLTGNKKLKIF